MSRRATVRILDALPGSMGVDSDPKVIDGEVVVPRPDRKAWAARGNDRCKSCWGKGMVGEIVTEAGAPRGSVRIERPCACVWDGIEAAEQEERQRTQGLLQPGRRVVLASKKPVEDAEARHRGRVDRVRQELALAEERLAAFEKDYAAYVAPFRAHREELERGAADMLALLATLRADLQERERTADEDRGLLASAQKTLEASLDAVVAAQDKLRQTEGLAAPAKNALAAARDRERLALNTGGRRHRVQVQQERVEQLRARLVRVEAEGPPSEAALAATEAAS